MKNIRKKSTQLNRGKHKVDLFRRAQKNLQKDSPVPDNGNGGQIVVATKNEEIIPASPVTELIQAKQDNDPYEKFKSNLKESLETAAKMSLKTLQDSLEKLHNDKTEKSLEKQVALTERLVRIVRELGGTDRDFQDKKPIKQEHDHYLHTTFDIADLDKREEEFNRLLGRKIVSLNP